MYGVTLTGIIVLTSVILKENVSDTDVMSGSMIR